jgi:hypothetical protein
VVFGTAIQGAFQGSFYIDWNTNDSLDPTDNIVQHSKRWRDYGTILIGERCLGAAAPPEKSGKKNMNKPFSQKQCTVPLTVLY